MSAYELPARVPRWNTETFSLAGREIQLAIPADPDQLLDDPEVLKESELNDYVPYWGYLWPAARCMAQRVAAAEWPKQTRVLPVRMPQERRRSRGVPLPKRPQNGSG